MYNNNNILNCYTSQNETNLTDGKFYGFLILISLCELFCKIYDEVKCLVSSFASLNIRRINRSVRFLQSDFFRIFCIFHTRLYPIYTHSILKTYSNYTHFILNIYSKHTHVPLTRRLSFVHVPFTGYSVYTRIKLNQTYSILFLRSNVISLHLGRPPPAFSV